MNTSVIHQSLVRPAGRVGIAIVVLFALSGCMTVDQSVALATQPVTAVAIGDANKVSAYDLASAMLQAGFSQDDILRYGPDVDDALATAGGAQVRQDKMVSALFAVHGNRLYVTSRTRGTFVVPLGGASTAG